MHGSTTKTGTRCSQDGGSLTSLNLLLPGVSVELQHQVLGTLCRSIAA